MTGQQLKNSILQMAVQGKLVPQDPNDEPASVLLERIRKEKEQLIKEGKIKKEKNPSRIFRGNDGLLYEKTSKSDPICIADEIPFEIPESWEWARLASICTKLVDGDHNPPRGEPTQTSFIMASSTNINNDMLVDLEKVRFLSGAIFMKENERTQASIGDIFFTSVGSLGRSCVYQGGLNICFQRSVSVLTTLIYNYYLKYFFDSSYVQQKILAEATGTAQKGFYLNQMAKLIVPIPPLSEQRRIVERIRCILPLLTNYSKKEIEISTLQSKFPDQLKKSILQEAVQGKLTSQDPTDEPASVLLERILAEKQRLIKEGKIKKDKHESIIFRRDNSYYEKLDGVERCIDDEIPFEIPESWEWSRLSLVSNMYTGNSINEREKKLKYMGQTEGLPYIGTKDVGIDYTIHYDNGVRIPFDANKFRVAPAESVLLCIEGGSAGRKISFTNQKVCFGNKLCCFAPLGINYRFLFYYLQCPLFLGLFKEQTSGIIGGVGLNTLKRMYLPIPPLAEQQRIARRLDSLFNNIDALRQQ